MSHEEVVDLRVRRTHKFLQEAMIELIGEKGFDAITVGDIAERAMINRATFYRHYQDKYDLVVKIFEETTGELVENMKPIQKEADYMQVQNPPEIWVQLFEHFAHHARLYRAMLGKNGSSWFVARMREYTTRVMLEQQMRLKQQVEPSRPVDASMPIELPAMQISHVLIGTIMWWLESDEGYTSRQMATWFHRFVYYGYLAVLGYAEVITEIE